jgi:hypothetical protein
VSFLRLPCSADPVGQTLYVRHTRQQIVQELRQRIQRKVYLPGARLPSRRELQQELGGSPQTIQAAFDQLQLQGYIVPQGSRGTFVAGHLPNQSTIALVFNEEFEQGSWNRFWSALHRMASNWVGAGEGASISFRSYCLAGGRLEGPVYAQLCGDLADGALAGVLFTSPPTLAEHSSLFTPQVPRVIIDGRPLGAYPFAVSHIQVPDKPALDSVFLRFLAKGRKRIAGVGGDFSQLERVRALAIAHGLEARPEWWHCLPLDAIATPTAQRIVHLLGTLPRRERPDGLLITDDNLVPSATSGILDASWQSMIDIDVVAHANVPLVSHAAVPCLRYGLNAQDLLQAAVTEILRLGTGAAPQMVQVPFTVFGSVGM